MESDSAVKPADTTKMRDTRPFIDRAWVSDNPEAYKELIKHPTQCPICMIDLTEGSTSANSANSPLLGEVASRCTHFACYSCWLEIWIRDQRSAKCRICRTNVYRWLLNTYDRPAATMKENSLFILGALVFMSDREECNALACNGWSLLERIRPP